MPKRVTSLIVKYRGGYLEVTSGEATYGRLEAMVSVDVGTAEEATAIGTQVLASTAADNTQFTVQILPTVAAPLTRPAFGFWLFDHASVPDANLQASSWRRVVGISIDQAPDGSLSFVPDLGNINDLREEELSRTVRRMIGGTLAGSVDAFAPTQIVTRQPKTHEPRPQPMVFSMPGLLELLTSGRWYARSAARIVKITASVGTPSSSSSVNLSVRVNGSSIATLNLGSGVNKVDTALQQQLVVGDYVTVTVNSTGTDAQDLTVQVDVEAESSPSAD